MNLKLKPVKCKSLSIVSGKPTPIVFNLSGNDVNSIENEPHKFLGSHLNFSGKQEEDLVFDSVRDHLVTRLDRIDNLLVRGEYITFSLHAGSCSPFMTLQKQIFLLLIP